MTAKSRSCLQKLSKAEIVRSRIRFAEADEIIDRQSMEIRGISTLVESLRIVHDRKLFALASSVEMFTKFKNCQKLLAS